MQKSKIKNQKHNLKLKTFLVLILVLIFTLCTLNLNSANAQGSQSFTISPPTIKFELNPGEKVEKAIKITNNSDTNAVFYVNIVDFIVTDDKGTPELLPADALIDNRYAASTWATVLPDVIVIPAGKTTTTTLYLQVPGDARPGGKYISVAFMPKSEGLSEESTGASVNSVAGALVYLTVNGEMAEEGRVVSFKAPSFSEYGPVNLITTIKNTGDIHINPKATIEIKDLLGRKVYTTALPSHLNVFPGATRIYDTAWEKKLLFGRFKASLTGYYGQENNLPLSAVTAFWVIPYKIILIVIALVVVGLIAYKKLSAPKEIVEETPPEEK